MEGMHFAAFFLGYAYTYKMHFYDWATSYINISVPAVLGYFQTKQIRSFRMISQEENVKFEGLNWNLK